MAELKKFVKFHHLFSKPKDQLTHLVYEQLQASHRTLSSLRIKRKSLLDALQKGELSDIDRENKRFQADLLKQGATAISPVYPNSFAPHVYARGKSL